MAETKAPTLQEIQKRAYELYVLRGGGHGYDLADWFAAERELTNVERESAPAVPKARAATVGTERVFSTARGVRK